MEEKSHVITVNGEWTHFTPKLYYNKYVLEKEKLKWLDQVEFKFYKNWQSLQNKSWWSNKKKI